MSQDRHLYLRAYAAMREVFNAASSSTESQRWLRKLSEDASWLASIRAYTRATKAEAGK